MKNPILVENTSYTFSDYFRLTAPLKEILNYFGYRLRRQSYDLPHGPAVTDSAILLKNRWQETLPYIELANEMARREFLIAPVLMEVIRYTQAEISVEYPLNVTEQLKGTLDYYLTATHQCLVIEAKNGDLEKGFTQLAVELVAIDQWLENPTPCLYGAVSMGNVWQFGKLDRPTKLVTQDLNLFRVPADVEELLQVLIGILTLTE